MLIRDSKMVFKEFKEESMALKGSYREGLFHVHSDYSHDGILSLQDLAAFCTEKQYDFIFLTEHAESFNESKMQAYVQECDCLSSQEVILIPGLEFGFREYPGLHLLGIGIREYIGEGDIVATLNRIHEQKGLSVVAHPSRNGHFLPDEIRTKISGIEIWNAAYDSRFLPHHTSLRLFTELKKKNSALIALGGLDMHDISGFRDLTIRINGLSNEAEDLIHYLRKGSFINIGKFLSIEAMKDPGYLFPYFIKGGRMALNLLDQLYWTVRKLLNNFRKTSKLS